MTTNILSQGLTTETENSVGATLIKCLKSENYKSFIFISAFASEAGINGLSEHIEEAKKTYESLNIIVGVDQKGTSKEALDALSKLGINAFIFYQPNFSIFHPKIYLFEGDERSELIIGSSNLTTQGLFINVEASIHLELVHSVPEEMQIVLDLKAKFKELFDFKNQNLKPITAELIDQFVAEKMVPTEAQRKEIQKKIEEQLGEPTERIIRTLFPSRELPSAPNGFRRKRPRKVHENNIIAPEITTTEPILAENFELVWRRGRLPASSVEIAGTANTNPTGGLRLVQDKFQVDGETIDQTTYFRENVFGDLTWAVVRQNPLVERAIGQFYVSISGENLGVFALEIRHKPSGEAGQHNYTTSISWGELSKNVRERRLTGLSLKLYRSEDTHGTFKIEIV